MDRLAQRLGAAGALVLVTELASPAGLGWSVLVVALGLSSWVWRVWGDSVLDRVVPTVWLWAASVALLAFASPLLPFLARPSVAVAVALLPWVVLRSPPGAGPRPAWSPAAAREWTAAVAPAMVLSLPALVHRSTAGVLEVLSMGWDTPNHLLLLRASLVTPGIPDLGTQVDRLLPPELHDYPGGGSSVWAALARLCGVSGEAPLDLVGLYPWLAALTWVAATLTAIWTYRRLAPWARSRWVDDLVGLAVIVLLTVVAPVAGMWWAGFHNFVLAGAVTVLLLGLCVQTRAEQHVVLLLGSAGLVLLGWTYPLLLPTAMAAWLLLVVRAWRSRRRRRGVIALLVVATALAGLPALLPYARGRGSEQLVAAGGMVAAPWGWLLSLCGIVVVTATVSRTWRVRLGRSTPILEVAVLMVPGIAAVTWLATGVVGYYAEKALYGALVLLVPCAAAATSTLVLALRQERARPRVLGALGLAMVAVVTAALGLSEVPRDPRSVVVDVPGPRYLTAGLAEGATGWVHGGRLLEVGERGRSPVAARVVPLDAWLGSTALSVPALVLDQHWSAVLQPGDASAGGRFTIRSVFATGLPGVVCAAVALSREDPGTPVLLVATDEATAAEAVDAVARCPGGAPASVSVEVGSLPPTLERLRRYADPVPGGRSSVLAPGSLR